MKNKFMALILFTTLTNCSAGAGSLAADPCYNYSRSDLASETIECDINLSPTCGFDKKDDPMALKNIGNNPGFVCNCRKTASHPNNPGVYYCISI